MLHRTKTSEYFTGEKALSRVKRDENMMNWFAGLATQVRSLDMEEGQATSTGRKIQGLIAGLSLSPRPLYQSIPFGVPRTHPLIYQSHIFLIYHAHLP